MIIRYALFEGKVHEGRENAFRRYVEEKLVPLWRQFPGAQDVQVYFGVERDDGAPEYALMMAIRYPDRDTVAKALESDVRYQSREVTQGLMTMFTGRIHHHVLDGKQYSPA
ncbi:hypothetical protein FJU08_11825 [Martelella alba]|uniref:Ethyl tert-butyl ether degradation EthD n=1 Tax=Martelella alba TaxID=2590451 RepID=A0A506UAB8_9HYPH|nr:hypothetical protein [Martelella alba]TPW30014.1 hypothetical protein FJU08_11825 [Martelella alba]